MWVKHMVRGEACDQVTCLLEDRLEAVLVGMAGDRWSRLKIAFLWSAVGVGRAVQCAVAQCGAGSCASTRACAVCGWRGRTGLRLGLAGVVGRWVAEMRSHHRTSLRSG